MTGELILSSYTYNQGRIALNNSYSASTSFHDLDIDVGGKMMSGGTNLYDIFCGCTTKKTFITLDDDSSTITWDYSTGYNAIITLTGTSGKLNITNVMNGDYGTLIVCQDAIGSKTMTLPSGSFCVNGGGGTITFSSTPTAVDIISFVYNGTNFFWSAGYNYTASLHWSYYYTRS